MVKNCANPDCGAEFLYLHEGELFVIASPDHHVDNYWLCPLCAPSMRVVYDASQGARLVPRIRVLHSVRPLIHAGMRKAPTSGTALRTMHNRSRNVTAVGGVGQVV